jgi:hypothetical protein
MKGKLKKLDKDKLPVYEIVIDDNDNTGISLISLVDEPAIVMKGMLFSEEKTMMSFKEVDEDKQEIVGPALIPNMKIYREDEKYGQYYVVFSKETIEKMVEKFNKYGSNRRINIDHSNQMVDGFIMEDWIVEDPVYDKSRKYGFEVPVGTYMIKVKIEDKDFWMSEVKENGKFGFSIEGLLGQQLVSLSKREDEVSIDDLTLEDLLQIFEEVKLKSYADYPDGVKNNAKKVLEYTEKNGWGSCGTPVGKVRANQLAKGEAISLETIKRMYSYLSRHEGDLDTSTSFSDGCGYMMYMSWGGKAALGWSRNKLRELGELNEDEQQFKNWRNTANSSNVDKMKYNDETKELVIKFNDGSYYTYFDIDFEQFMAVVEGDGTCVTQGQNEYGSWSIGKNPSVGAAVWEWLINAIPEPRFVRGGSLR